MTDKDLQSLIDAPLCDPAKLAIHGEPRKIRRGPRMSNENCADGGLCISRAQAAARKSKLASEKLGKLFDYYASTDLPAQRVAEYLGLYRQVQSGTDDKGKPTFERILDVKHVAEQLAWRRAQAA